MYSSTSVAQYTSVASTVVPVRGGGGGGNWLWAVSCFFVLGWSQDCLAVSQDCLSWSQDCLAGVRIAWLESGLLGWSGGKVFVPA